MVLHRLFFVEPLRKLSTPGEAVETLARLFFRLPLLKVVLTGFPPLVALFGLGMNARVTIFSKCYSAGLILPAAQSFKISVFRPNAGSIPVFSERGYPALQPGYGEDAYVQAGCRLVRVNESHQLW